MSHFTAFFQLGFQHIVGLDALDHILFLVVLAAVYRTRDWRDVLWVVSAFTIGHSITLALAVTDSIKVNQPLIEVLIPLTIVITAAENLLVRDRARHSTRWYRPLLAGVFGLVHGAGFAGYLKGLFLSDITVPLLGFNVGIEIGQLLVLAVIAALLPALDTLLRRVLASVEPGQLFRARVVCLSVTVGLMAAVWTVERQPW